MLKASVHEKPLYNTKMRDPYITCHRGAVAITKAQFHSTKPELRFCPGSNLAHCR